MLFTANGLGMLQSMSIVAAFSFAFIMILSMMSLFRALRRDEMFKSANIKSKNNKTS